MVGNAVNEARFDYQLKDSSVEPTGRYKAYAEYKDSGIEWLGEIPSGWEVVPIKYLATLTPKKSSLSKFLMLEDCSFIPMEKLKLDSIILDESRVISSVYDGYTYFENEDILMAKVTPCFENKNIAVASNLINGVGFGSSEIYVLRTNFKANNRYLFYRLQESVFMGIAIANMTGAGGLKRVPAEIINEYSIAIPHIKEQKKISSFLDHETTKIDTLVKKQRRLVELLTEKRQAVISHAVTKGLNPDVSMKDSGVEWLGEVPEHWEVSKLKFECEIVDCRNKTPEYFKNGEYFVVRTTNVRNQKLNFNGALYTDEKNFKIWTQRGVPPSGSILFTREAPTGKVCIVPSDLKFCMGQRMMNFIAYENYYTSYLFDYLISDCLDRYINSVSIGSTVSHLRVEQVQNIPVLVPPQNEIEEIHSHIEKFKLIYNEMESKATMAIQLMQERRTALISAAVTGKIDVRDWGKTHPEVLT